MGKLSDIEDLKKQLQKSCFALKDYIKEVSSSEISIRTRLKSITNLTEQLLSCKSVKDSDLPDGAGTLLKDVKERLILKLTELITEDLHELHQTLQQQTECCEKFTKLYEICLAKFDKLNKQEYIQLLTERSALYPTLSEMLEMLNWSECRLRENCLAKKYILEEFRPEKYGDEEVLEKTWFTCDKIILEKIEDFLMLTSFFMNEKIT